MDAGINNIIYMELHSGPKMANGTGGKTIIAGTIDRGSTVVSWGTMLCSMVDGHQRLKVTRCLHVQSTRLLVYVNKIVPQISRLIFPFKFWLKM
jgi:hypothetical protein